MTLNRPPSALRDDLLLGFALLVCGAAGCSDAPSRPREIASACTASGSVTALAELQATTLRGADASCLRLTGDGAAYLLVPQFATGSTPFGYYGYQLGAPATPASLDLSPLASRGGAEQEPSPALRFHRALREAERGMRFPRGQTFAPSASRAAASPPPVGSTTTFSVLSTLNAPQAYASSTARLEYAGDHVLLYVDVASPASFTSAQLSSLGALLDGPLYATDRAAFGDESDVDGNGRVIVLLTPVVNALVDQITCARSGWVNGFFWGFDLTGARPSANGGEIVYAVAPDPQGVKSCPHSVAEVLDLLPDTFIHELQHMINFGEHVIRRNGTAEELWLNEGLSHLAEELGSLYFERRYPPPTGRTDPTQMFPDSALPFIRTDLSSAYGFLENSASYSVTTPDPTGYGALEERAAAWLFLRWLADGKGDDVLRRLVGTAKTGVANVEEAAGEPFPSLFGDFGLALWADSIPGAPRAAIPARDRFASRNLRALFWSLFQSSSGLFRPYPIVLDTLRPDATGARSMRPGTMRFHYLRTAPGEHVAVIGLVDLDGNPFREEFGAQMGVLRLPAP